MKHIFFILILIPFWSFAQQNYINRNYQNQEGSGNWISSSMILHNGEYIINGGYSVISDECPDQWSRGVFFVSIDSSGNITNQKHYSSCNMTWYEGQLKSQVSFQENIAAIVKKNYHDTIISSCNLFIINSDLDTLFTNEYLTDTTSKRIRSIIKTVDNDIMIIGSIDTTHSENNLTGAFVQVMLTKLDTVGNIKWNKTYQYQESLNYAYNIGLNITEMFDKGYVITGGSKEQGEFIKNLLIKTDSLGNEEWHQIRGSSSYSNPLFTDIIETRDSCILVCGAYTYGETYGGLYPYDGWLIKLNPDGSTVWNRKFRDSITSTGAQNDFYAYYKAIAEKENGEIITLVQTMSNLEGEFIGDKFRIRCHFPNGDIKWDKYIDSVGSVAAAFYPNSIALDENENIIVSGWGDFYYYDVNDDWTYDQRIFLIKTDSLGNDHFVSVSEPQTKPITRYELVVYPNPASNYLFIETHENSQANGELTIVNQSGQIVYQNHTTKDTLSSGICVSNFTPGNYLIQLKTENKTYFGKFVKY